MEKFNRFLRQIKKARQEIKFDRKNFWNKNKINFKNNIKTLVSFFPAPEGWTVSVIASYFLLDKESMPYDRDVWSFVDIVGATKNQGHDVVVFFNRADLEFLSAPALLPIVVHEMYHIIQASRDPKEYVQATVDDEKSRKFEKEADAEVAKYSAEFRRENILEKIMYCYDKRGWEGAKKMADYLFKEAQNAFGGGYDQEMKQEEYDIFLKSEDEKDIDIFIDYFIESINKELEAIEKKEESKKENR